MKKFSRLLAALASLALVSGSLFVSCSHDSSSGGGGGSTPKVTDLTLSQTSAKLSLEGTKTVTITATVTADDGVPDADKVVTWTVDADENGDDIVTLPENKTENSILVTATKVGSTKLAAKVGGIVKECTITVVATDAEITPDEEEDDFWTWTASENNTTGADITVSATTAYKQITIGADANNTVTIATDRIKLASRKFPTATTWYKDADKTLVARTLMFTAPAGTKSIIINAAAGSTSSTSNLTLVSESDRTTPVLAHNFEVLSGDVSSATYEDVTQTFDEVLAEDTVFYILNLKESSGNFTTVAAGGGIAIKSIQVKGLDLTPYDAPTEANFDVGETASDGKATVTLKNLTSGATLQYAKGASAWADVESGATSLSLEAGNYNFRYKKDSTHTASENYALKIEEYVNPALEPASAPAANSVTATATTTAANNDGKLTVNTATESRALQYSDDDGSSWSDFTNGEATRLEGGKTYKIRVKTSSTYNASTATISVVVKKFTAAPSESDFTVTKARPNASDGAITAKSANVIANLYVVTEDGDKAWSELADDGGLTISNLKTDTYQAFYAETETTAKSANGSIEVGTKDLIERAFEKFELGADFDAILAASAAKTKAITANGKTKIEGSSAKLDLSDTNATWALSIPSGKSMEVKDGTESWWQGSYQTYDTTYTYTRRIAYTKSGATLKLKIGNKAETILRVDAGGVGSATQLTFKGEETAQTWDLQYEGIKYISITGDDDGYVTITQSSENNVALYGIHVVTEIPSSYSAETVVASEYATTYALAAADLTLDKDSASNADGQSIALTIAATATKTANKVKWDGTLSETGTAAAATNSDFKYTIAGAEDATLPTVTANTDTAVGAKISTSGATKGEYTLTVKLGNMSEKKTFKVTSSTAISVTFKADDSDEGKKYDVDVGDKFPSAATVGLTTPSGKSFAGWSANANAGEATYTTESDIPSGMTADSTLYAVWKVAESNTYSFLASSAAAGKNTELFSTKYFSLQDTVQNAAVDSITAITVDDKEFSKVITGKNLTLKPNVSGSVTVYVAVGKSGGSFSNGSKINFTDADGKVTEVVDSTSSSATTFTKFDFDVEKGKTYKFDLSVTSKRMVTAALYLTTSEDEPTTE